MGGLIARLFKRADGSKSAVSTLLGLGGKPLGSQPPRLMPAFGDFASTEAPIAEMLNEKNGCFAYDGALHIFPSGDVDRTQVGYSLQAWNESALWRNGYEGLNPNMLFFAEDLFGCQFGICDGIVYKLDPETGKVEQFANDLESWAAAIIAEPDVETGRPLAAHWLKRSGRIGPGQRLVPKAPFVAGGQFELGNLFVMDAAESMDLRASIARQIKGLPDGTKIKIRLAP